MAVKNVVVGNVLVAHWSDVVTVADVDTIFNLAKRTCQQSGKIAGISILGPNMERPSVEVFGKMAELHPRMREFHMSVHYVLLVKGFLATGIMSNVTRILTSGTGGTLGFHKSVQEAMADAAKYQNLTGSSEKVLAELKKLGIPTSRI